MSPSSPSFFFFFPSSAIFTLRLPYLSSSSSSLASRLATSSLGNTNRFCIPRASLRASPNRQSFPDLDDDEEEEDGRACG